MKHRSQSPVRVVKSNGNVRLCLSFVDSEGHVLLCAMAPVARSCKILLTTVLTKADQSCRRVYNV